MLPLFLDTYALSQLSSTKHLLLFLPHRCPKIGENCPKLSKNSVQMGPIITAVTVPYWWKFYEDSTQLYKIEIVALVVMISWFYPVHFFDQIYYKPKMHKKWTWWNWNISLTNTSQLKSDKFIKMLIKIPLIWYIVGFCRSKIGRFFWIWISSYF